MNKDDQAHRYQVAVSGIDGLQLEFDQETVEVAAGEVADVPVHLRTDPKRLQGRSTPMEFGLQAVDDPSLTAQATSRFLAPIRQ